MMTGEYFLSEKQKEGIKHEKKRTAKEQKKQEKIEKKAKLFEAPVEDAPAKEEKQAETGKPSLDELKKKFLKKKQ